MVEEKQPVVRVAVALLNWKLGKLGGSWNEEEKKKRRKRWERNVRSLRLLILDIAREVERLSCG